MHTARYHNFITQKSQSAPSGSLTNQWVVVTDLPSGTHSKSIVVDQTVPLPDGKAFCPIGTVDLEATVDTVIQVANADAAVFVIRDALQLLSIEPESSP